jgi:hypothetical protein
VLAPFSIKFFSVVCTPLPLSAVFPLEVYFIFLGEKFHTRVLSFVQNKEKEGRKEN